MVRINIFRCPLADALRTSQGSAKPRVVQERADLSARNSGQRFLSSQKHTPYALVWGQPRAPAGLEQPRQKRVPWRPPRSQTDTPAGSKLDPTLELTERHGLSVERAGVQGPSRRPPPGLPAGRAAHLPGPTAPRRPEAAAAAAGPAARAARGSRPGCGGTSLGGRDLRSAGPGGCWQSGSAAGGGAQRCRGWSVLNFPLS